MKFIVTSVTVASLITTIVGLTIDSPASVVQCQPTQLTWHDGTPPYYLSVLPGGQPSAPPLKSFPPTNGTALTWTVDIAAPTPITLSLKDSTGTQAYSSIINIGTAGDSSCINANVTITGSTGTAAPTTPGATSPAASGATTTGSATSKGSSTGTGSSSPASTSKSAASQTGVAALGLAGIMGLVGAALF